MRDQTALYQNSTDLRSDRLGMHARSKLHLVVASS
jgi:hypothetical protein